MFLIVFLDETKIYIPKGAKTDASIPVLDDP